MVARCSPEWDDAAGVAAQANAIGERAVELAHTDGRVWEDALTALRDAEAGATDDPRRDFALEQKLEAAAAAPLEIASLGADVAALAARRGRAGRRDVPRRTLPLPPHSPPAGPAPRPTSCA